VSENKVLAHPASVVSVSTSAAKEDHVSMGAHAARKATQIVDNVARVIAIEALCAAQALDFLKPLKAGAGVEASRRALRRRIARLQADRVLATDIEHARELVEDAVLQEAAEGAVGPLA
jgi:histidine ammonia-lyase